MLSFYEFNQCYKMCECQNCYCTDANEIDLSGLFPQVLYFDERWYCNSIDCSIRISLR